MKSHLLLAAVIAAPLVGLGSLAAKADTIIFNSNAGSTASPLSFTVGGGTGSLSGWEFTPSSTYTAVNLYQKSAGSDEMGIGIAGDFDNEISNSRNNQCHSSSNVKCGAPYGVVVIDLGASGSVLRNDAAAGTLGLSFNSVQAPDAGGIYFETTAPGTGPDLSAASPNVTIGTAQDNGANPLFVKTTDEYLYITTDINNANQYSILLHDIEAPVPEPATLALLGTGLLGLGAIRRRRSKA